jgi:DUF971 family protein
MTNTRSPLPTSLKGDGEALAIRWDDGATHRLRWETLRRACPCATCRAEREKEAVGKPPAVLPVLPPEEAQPVRAADVRPIGNYAYQVEFTDGHNTGIYTLEYLRLLGEEAARRGAS